MNEMVFTADRLNRQRAQSLAEEVERRRSIADRGPRVSPQRPVVDAVRRSGFVLLRVLHLAHGAGARPAAL